MLTLISFILLIALTIANPQYPPSGWRPKGTPFVLPREYLPSSPLKNAAQYEINRERLEYIGQYQVRDPFYSFRNNFEQEQLYQPQQQQQQLQQQQLQQQRQKQQFQKQIQIPAQIPAQIPELITTTEQFIEDRTIPETTTTEYPTTTQITLGEDYLRVQSLPSLEQPLQFKNVEPKNTQLNKNTSTNQQQNNNQRGQIKQQQQQQQQQQPLLSQKSKLQQQGALKGQVAFVNTDSTKFGKQIVLTSPGNTYGSPTQITPNQQPVNSYGPPQEMDQTDNESLAENDSNNDTEDDVDNENENNDNSDEQQFNNIPQSNIAISNSINRNGQYYILSPDNLLQRVVFMTTPNRDDTGFTAQLRYMPVEPIRDPIYAYNEQGQLVKIFRK